MSLPMLGNRTAVLIRHKQPYLDWAKSLDEEDGVDPLPAGHTTIYLIPDHDDGESMEAELKSCYASIFEEELESWSTDPKQWPKDRSFKVFQAWFDYEAIEMVHDVGQEEIELA